MYYCNQGTECPLPTIVLRFSDTPHDYISGFSLNDDRIKIAKSIAKNLGLWCEQSGLN